MRRVATWLIVAALFISEIGAGATLYAQSFLSTTIENKSSAGVKGSSHATNAQITADGSTVVFESSGKNLVDGYNSLYTQIYVRTLSLGATSLVSTTAEGVIADRDAQHSSISRNGYYLVFVSDAQNLLSPGPGTFVDQVYLKKLHTGQISVVSTTSLGALANGDSRYPSISDDGTLAAFYAQASDLTGESNASCYVKNLSSGEVTLTNRGDGPGGTVGAVSYMQEYRTCQIAPDGKNAFFITQTDIGEGTYTGWRNIYKRDLTSNQTTLISHAPGGGLSDDGHAWTFDVSWDGTRILYLSRAENLLSVPPSGKVDNGFDDVFVYDTTTGVTALVSRSVSGGLSNGHSSYPKISSNGKWGVFTSRATNLIASDTNTQDDIFYADLDVVLANASNNTQNFVARLSTDQNGNQSTGASYQGAINDAATRAVFSSRAQLITEDQDAQTDIYLKGDDQCPTDPNKFSPGICGCGTADTDSDSDGSVDCSEECPSDPAKTMGGVCGCGTPDTDTDKDGTPNCAETCDEDPGKTAPGSCGCGVQDVDSDRDGTLDCQDECPQDSAKTQSGACGCGSSEEDRDGDGTPDCNDQCPVNPNRTEQSNGSCSDDNNEGTETPCSGNTCQDPDEERPATGPNPPEAPKFKLRKPKGRLSARFICKVSDGESCNIVWRAWIVGRGNQWQGYSEHPKKTFLVRPNVVFDRKSKAKQTGWMCATRTTSDSASAETCKKVIYKKRKKVKKGRK